eukprot:g12543.t1
MAWVWEVPAGWIDAPEVSERLIADYRFKGSNQTMPGRVTVSKIDGEGGGVNANVMRWLGQIYITTPQGLGPDDRADSFPIGKNTLTFVDLHGQYQGEHMPTRIYAIIYQIASVDGGVFQTWFFKMAGDDETIEKGRAGLAQMALTLRPEGANGPAMKPSKANPIAWLASLRLTVVLLAMSMYLIFVGTLAQVESGIWQVVEKYFRSGFVYVPFDVFRSLIDPGSEDRWAYGHWFPGGFLVIGLLLVNLLAAHAVRYKVTGKGTVLLVGFGLVAIGSAFTAYTVLEPETSATIQQNVMLMMAIWAVPMTLIGVGCHLIFGGRKAGIVLVHGGLILMLVGEYITGIGATEGQMWIHEQGASNTIRDIRESEVAFVRDLGDGKEEHVVIPQAVVVAAEERDEPINDPAVPVTVRVDKWMANTAKTGVSFEGGDRTKPLWKMEEAPTVTGTESAVDQPSVVVTLFDGDQRLGEFLLSTVGTVRPIQLELEEESWEVSLRFKETHLPYTIQLVDFRHDKFTGTTTPMNYSSTMHLDVPASGESRDVFIKMNQPLRYDQKAFFQSGFFQQSQLNQNLGTVLQVADNPGAWVPYLSCVVVTVGLCMHFVVLQVLPYVFAAVIALYLLMGVQRATQPESLYLFDFDTFGKVPVSQDGRIKPLDTVARNALLQISQKRSLKDDMLLPEEGGVEKPAIVWLAELMSSRPEAMQRRVIRIDDPGVLGLIGKTPEDGTLFSFGEFMIPPSEGAEPIYLEVGRQAERAEKVRDDLRKPFDEQVIGLSRKLALMQRLRINAMPFVVPPEVQGDEWIPIVKDARVGLNDAAIDRQAGRTWLDMMSALQADNPTAFNKTLNEHLALKQDFVPVKARKASFEQGYNRYAPFKKGVALYILAALLGLFAMLLRPLLPNAGYTALWRSGMGVLIVAFLLHTAALIIRIWLQGRPPVTNLYSSAVFIGWGIVGGAIVLEKITKLGVASLAASSAGIGTLLVALHLSKDGDTMGVMQAVLDSNFWLGTHVITITLGYSATFLAGFIAICYIVFGMTTTLMDRKTGRAITGMVYAVTCFALLFSFVGTVLGGIWADQSWGRFWGWDPKENGAILIVLMNAIILHARWGHLVKERGIMVLAIGGNIVTIWSWFGTNMLGVGLHAYGFMDGAWAVLTVIAVNILMLMAVPLLLPTGQWYMNYRRKHPPFFSPSVQIIMGGALLFVGLGAALTLLAITLFGDLNVFYWSSGWLLLFMVVAGLGQLIEGTQLYLDENGREAGAMPA